MRVYHTALRAGLGSTSPVLYTATINACRARGGGTAGAAAAAGGASSASSAATSSPISLSSSGLPATASYPKPVLQVSATVGGIAATVDYLGAAPYFVAGVFQFNVKIPAGVTPGNAVPVVVKVGDAESPAVVTIAVK